MPKFLIASGTAVLSVILFGGVLVYKSDARNSAADCVEGLTQESRARCTRLLVPKHQRKKKQESSGSQAQPGTRCSRLDDGTYVEPGSYTAGVEVDDGCGCLNVADVTIPIVACSDCKPQ